MKIEFGKYKYGWLDLKIDLQTKLRNKKDIFNISISYVYPPFAKIKLSQIIKHPNKKLGLKEYYQDGNILCFLKNIKCNNKAYLEINQEGYFIKIRTIPLKDDNILFYVEDGNKYKIKLGIKNQQKIKNLYEKNQYKTSKRHMIKKIDFVKKFKNELLDCSIRNREMFYDKGLVTCDLWFDKNDLRKI